MSHHTHHTHHPAHLRAEYQLARLTERDAGSDPFQLFDRWFRDALAASTGPAYEPNVMTLATCSPDGEPDARIVLLKGYSPAGFTFFTNYHSAKGEQLTANPRAALVFHWLTLERQVRVAGSITTTPDDESDSYFASRPRDSQLGAWVSNQSRPVTLEDLERELQRISARYEGRPVPRPPHWGGYILSPHRIEFWQGRPGRLHDRILFHRPDPDPNLPWSRSRLAP